MSTQRPATPSGSSSDAELLAYFTAICERAGRGDLEARVVGVDPSSDMGRLGHAVNAMLDMADSFVREASAVMEHCGRDQFHRPILLQGLKGGYRQSAVVINKAGLKMRESHDEIVFAGELAGQNLAAVSSVAGAVTELNATSGEIARQASESAVITQQAVQEVAKAGDAVEAMNGAVKMIDRMVTLINTVAHQTNLPALNATIEAARAGEAGKGFAVVASEVKELSRNTAMATADISEQVERIQDTAGQVAGIIRRINESIQRIDGGASTIATSVSEQVHATSEITRSITEVSRNAEQVAERINARIESARA